MNRVPAAILQVIILMFIGGCASAIIPTELDSKSDSAVEAPIYSGADRWTYRILVENTRSAVFSVLSQSHHIVDVSRDFWDKDDSDINRNAIWATVHLKDPQEIRPLDFPLFPGKWWTYEYSAFGEKSPRFARVEVIGPTVQPVRTAAGEFNAVELRRVETWRNTERITIYFYSPTTKSVVKLQSQQLGFDGSRNYEMELVKHFVAN